MRLIAVLALTASLMAAPQRIISTGPGITEILFALGAGSRVVGVTQYCNYPPEARRIARIGTWMTPNFEAILAQRPDLVIVQKTAIHDDKKFRALSLNTITVDLSSIADIETSTLAIGKAIGSEARATQLVANIRRELETTRKLVADKPQLRVMFVAGRTPGTLEGVIVAGARSYLTEVMEMAGGRSAFADLPMAYGKVGHEQILARDPEIIIDMGEHAEAEGITEAQRKFELGLWSKYSTLSAVKNNRIHIVASDLYVHPGPRVIELAREFVRLLHPEIHR